MDCLREFVDTYLYNNRKQLDGFKLYAHNSGKFDTLLIIRECLLESEKWFISEEELGALELNGRWLNLTIKSLDNCELHQGFLCVIT